VKEMEFKLRCKSVFYKWCHNLITTSKLHNLGPLLTSCHMYAKIKIKMHQHIYILTAKTINLLDENTGIYFHKVDYKGMKRNRKR
jgi:hypothetical protein